MNIQKKSNVVVENQHEVFIGRKCVLVGSFVDALDLAAGEIEDDASAIIIIADHDRDCVVAEVRI